MSFHRTNRGEDLMLVIQGDLDAAAVAELRGEIESVISGPSPRVIVDLSAVDFIDSSGIGVLVFLFKRLRSAGCELLLAGARGQTDRMLSMLRIYEYIPHVSELRNLPLSTVRA